MYSAARLAEIPVSVAGNRFELDQSREMPTGVSRGGIGMDFSVEPPLSLYGASKLASETLAREYGEAFSLPVIINRCGVLAAESRAGQRKYHDIELATAHLHGMLEALT